MVVSVRSVEKNEVVEDDSHSIEYGIPSVEEVKKVDLRARFAEIDARMLEESESNVVSSRSRGAEEDENPPVVQEEEPAEEEIVIEMPAEKAEKKKKGVEKKFPEVDLSRVPYPACLLPYKNAREYDTFLDMFKQLKVNIPFIEVLQHMPKYDKFLKDLLSNKKKLEGISKVSLSKKCSAVVQNKLPEKMPDSGRFTIPCLLSGLPLNHALADLGASVNLMSYYIYKQLDLREPQPTRMRIFLADRLVKYPRGIVENLLVRVVKFIFPVDFVIMDMEVDDKLEGLLDEPDDYDDEVLDDLLEMMADFEEIIGKTPSVGKLVEVVEDPDDPGEGLEVPFIENLIPEPLPSTIVLTLLKRLLYALLLARLEKSIVVRHCCNDLSSRHKAVSSKASSVDAAEKSIRSNFGLQQIRLSAADMFFSRRTSIRSS
ncbi:hypothetical protein L1987_18889 [Smallanthus sonchifolius]|uniref:Uncharacterized protein n=1 Tax=Smallanthus sonchifolius TaxID=185202 RepID=A0ACB9J203_9ASTR|nr:hypothetical protein L1987_18889 [Smallanthus sonchifolius]